MNADKDFFFANINPKIKLFPGYSSADESAVVILSGGQDSTTCLYAALKVFDKVYTITFDYGQRHSIEIESAQKIAHMAGVSNELINIDSLLHGTSPLVSDKNPEQYEHWSKLPGGLEDTFVPARNILFLTIAANRAYVLKSRNIIIGVSQEDFGGYPDCRMEFITSMTESLIKGLTLTDHEFMSVLRVQTPLIDLDKKETVELALRLDGCYEALAYSHTAYDGQYPPTGKDHASLLRAKGFELAGVPDPLVMRAYKETKMLLPQTYNYNQKAIEKYYSIMEYGAL